MNFSIQKTFERHLLIVDGKKFDGLKFYIFTIPIMGIWFHEQMFIRNPFRQNKWAITHNIFRSCGLISISFNCLLMNRSEGGKTKDTWEKRSRFAQCYCKCVIINRFHSKLCEICNFSRINLFTIANKINDKRILRCGFGISDTTP